MLAVLDGDALSLMIIIRHGDVMDTSEREKEGHFKDRLSVDYVVVGLDKEGAAGMRKR
jgi:hypothetical protein